MADYIALVKKNSERIRGISNILIGTGERRVERFENAALLFCQLADEFEDSLQDFTVKADISELSSFAGAFDVLEMRRVFDNLISNSLKQDMISDYAEGTVNMPGYGVSISNSSKISLFGNEISLFESGIFSQHSTQLIIDNNTLRENNYCIYNQ